MSSIDEIAIRTPLAAVANGNHIRLYQLDVNGGVREAQYEGSWGGGQASNTIGTVRLNSPLSATNIGFSQIRVYGIDNDDTIKELAYDAGRGYEKIHVYAQLPNNTIQEYRWGGSSWGEADNLGEALPGTSITAMAWGASEDSASIRVYFQTPTKTVVEKGKDAKGAWYDGWLSFPSDETRAALAAVSFDGPHLCLFYTAPGGEIREKVSGGHWSDGDFRQPALPASSVAVVSIGGEQLRIYLQNGTDNTAVT
ncbi:hypothetical protein C8A00DRAFT_36521, partial [Chaetomidium leptoderma]